MIMFGMAEYTDMVPKFVKQFGQIGNAMTEAFKDYIAETKAQTFPAEEHTFKISDEVMDELTK